jgi:hypothetical protein
MPNYTDSLKELGKATQKIKPAKLREPLQKFARKKLHPLMLRTLTSLQEQFKERLQAILLEQEPKEAFYNLCYLYSEALPEQRFEIRKRWDFNRTWELPDQTTLACDLPEDRSSEERIRASLIYTSLMNDYDYRDVLVWLAPIYHSALKSGINAESLFKEISDISSPIAASLIHSFINRPPNSKSLSAWCLEEDLTAQGVRIRHR